MAHPRHRWYVEETRFCHKPPAPPPRTRPSPPSSAGSSPAKRPVHYAYVLMHDKKGWLTSLGAADITDENNVDVEKGTLVEVDPECGFDPRTNISVNVVSLDRPNIKISLLMKELLVIEEDVFRRLLPLTPSERYELMTNKNRHLALSCRVGDSVTFQLKPNVKEVGLILYIGEVLGMGPGDWFGVELITSTNGTCDGSYNGRQYFNVAPLSGVFVTAAQLLPYDSNAYHARAFAEDYDELNYTNEKNNAMRTTASPISTVRIVSGEDYSPTQTSKKNRVAHVKMSPLASFLGRKLVSSPFCSSTESETVLDQGRLDIRPLKISTYFAPAAKSFEKADQEEGIEVKVHDRVVWLSDNGAEFGYVRWIGHVVDGDSILAGVAFDNPIGNGDGIYHNTRLFKTKKGHASLVPLEGLLKAEDYNDDMKKSKKRHPMTLRRRVPTPHAPDNESTVSTDDDDKTSHKGGKKAHEIRVGDFIHQEKRRGRESRLLRSPSNSSAPSSPTQQKEPPPQFDPVAVAEEAVKGDLEIGTLVELRKDGEPFFGVVRWTGWLIDKSVKGVGVELEEELSGASNGWYNGTQLFACPEGKAAFAPFTHIRLDKRFGDEQNNNDLSNFAMNEKSQDFGGLDCPEVTGFHSPIKVSDINRISGRNKGVQGHQNSCYLDATLFAMFSFSSVFDSLLYRPQSIQDIPEYSIVQRVLREEIVNPLRKNLFVRADRVMKLRKLLDSLTSVKGLMSEEKDPEEFLNSLLTQTLKADPFLELSSGQTAHLYQLFVERDSSLELPTVQELFEQSLRTSNVRLKTVPSVLILQMPRFGRQFKVYDRIVPSPILDVTDIIEDSPRQCIICCSNVATIECLDCLGDHGTGLESTAFCEECMGTLHSHQKRKMHKPTDLKVPRDFLANRNEGSIPRMYMELFAVVCIETSHYVTFAKSALGPDTPWCFFDSMADRKGETYGYNIPEVSPALDVPHWLNEEGTCFLKSHKDSKTLPTHAKRLICDGYMCFYQSPSVMMYK